MKKETAKSLENDANGDLKYNWDKFVGQLIERDITFERIYTRMLEKDIPSGGL